MAHFVHGTCGNYLGNGETSTIFTWGIVYFANGEAHCKDTGWVFFTCISFLSLLYKAGTEGFSEQLLVEEAFRSEASPRRAGECPLEPGVGQQQQLGVGMALLTPSPPFLCHWMRQSPPEWQHFKLALKFLLLSTGDSFPLRHGVLLKYLFRISCSTVACCHFILH